MQTARIMTGTGPLHYEWVKLLCDQCRRYDVPSHFSARGTCLSKTGKSTTFARHTSMCRRCVRSAISRHRAGIPHSKTMQYLPGGEIPAMVSGGAGSVRQGALFLLCAPSGASCGDPDGCGDTCQMRMREAESAAGKPHFWHGQKPRCAGSLCT